MTVLCDGSFYTAKAKYESVPCAQTTLSQIMIQRISLSGNFCAINLFKVRRSRQTRSVLFTNIIKDSNHLLQHVNSVCHAHAEWNSN